MNARVSASILFLAHGLLVSTWVSRIPDVQSALALSPGVLGTALLAIAIGSLVAMPATGILITRRGSKVACTWTTYAMCAAVAGIALGRDALSLSFLLFLYGASAGAMDVSINAQGVSIERLRSRSVLSSLHALFSIGAMAGAAIGGQIARAGVPVLWHFAGAAVVCAALCAETSRWMIGPEDEHTTQSGPLFALPRRAAFALGALSFSILVCEGAIADWIAIFLRDALSAGPATAAAGYAVFSGAMAIGRLCGDYATDRLGPGRIVLAGSLAGAFGLAFALAAPFLTLALVALAFVGLGFAAIVPNVFAASGRIPGMTPGAGIAAVTTMGYSGFLIGPPLIGWLAEWGTLRQALFVLVALSLVSAALSPAVRPAAPSQSFEPDPHG
jgi:MFS family permease